MLEKTKKIHKSPFCDDNKCQLPDKKADQRMKNSLGIYSHLYSKEWFESCMYPTMLGWSALAILIQDLHLKYPCLCTFLLHIWSSQTNLNKVTCTWWLKEYFCSNNEMVLEKKIYTTNTLVGFYEISLGH